MSNNLTYKFYTMPSEKKEYLLKTLPKYLIGRNDYIGLKKILSNLTFIGFKILLFNAESIIQDFYDALNIETLKDNVELKSLFFAIRANEHLLNNCDNIQDIISTLHSRINHVSELKNLISETNNELLHPIITTINSMPDIQSNSLIRSLVGHDSEISCCAISPDGKYIASGCSSGNRTIKIWETESWKLKKTLKGHKATFNCCVIGSDNRTLVTGGDDLRIWDIHEGRERVILKRNGDKHIYSFSITEDCSKAIVSWGDRLILYDVWKKKEILTLHEGSVYSCSMSLDGSIIAATLDKFQLRVWDGNNAKIKFTLNEQTDENYVNTGHEISSGICQLSPNGDFVVVTDVNYNIKIYNSKNGNELLSFGNHGKFSAAINNCSITSDGNILVTTSNWNHTIKLWNISEQKEILTINEPRGNIGACAINISKMILVTGASEVLRVWDIRVKDNYFASIQKETNTENYLLSGDCNRLISQNSNKIIIWDIEKGKICKTIDSIRGDICTLSQDGKIFATKYQIYKKSKSNHEGRIKIYRTDTGNEQLTLMEQKEHITQSFISFDNNYISTFSNDDKEITLWDAKNGNLLLSLAYHQAKVKCIEFSPNNNHIVSTAIDGSVNLFNIKLKQVYSLNSRTFYPKKMLFNNECSVLVTSSRYNEVIKFFDITTGKEIKTLSFVNSSEGIIDFDINYEASILVYIPYSGSMIKAIDTATKNEIFCIQEEESNTISNCMFGFEDKYIYTVLDKKYSYNYKEIKIWNIKTKKVVNKIPVNIAQWIGKVCITDKYLVAPSNESEMNIWDIENGTILFHIKKDNLIISTFDTAKGTPLIAICYTNGLIEIWEITNKCKLKTIHYQNEYIQKCSLNHDGSLVSCLLRSNLLIIWDTMTGAEKFVLRLNPTSEPFYYEHEITSNNSLVACSLKNGSITVLDVEDKKELFNIPANTFRGSLCKVSRDGRYIAVSSDQKHPNYEIRVWDSESKKLLCTMNSNDEYYKFIISPDCSYIASINYKNDINIWNVTDGKKRCQLKGHKGRINDFDISLSNNALISVSEDRTIKIWDVFKELCVTTLHTEGKLKKCNWLKGSNISAIASGDNGFYFINLVHGNSEISNFYDNLYIVYLLNDEQTTTEFVLFLLKNVIGKRKDEAERIILETNHNGYGLCGLYSRKEAKAIVSAVIRESRNYKFPLKCGLIKDKNILHLFQNKVSNDVPTEHSLVLEKQKTNHKNPIKTARKTLINGKVQTQEEGFKGRNCLLQRAIHVLENNNEPFGIIITGTLGVGKSNLCGKIIKRFLDKKLVLHNGCLTINTFFQNLIDLFDQYDVQSGLSEIYSDKNPEEKIEFLFSNSFQELPSIIYLEDFEQNLEHPEGAQDDHLCHVKNEFLPIIRGLLKALTLSKGKIYLIINSKYPFTLIQDGCDLAVESLHRIPLMPMYDFDFDKNMNLSTRDPNPLFLEWPDIVAADEHQDDLNQLKEEFTGKQEECRFEYHMASKLASSQGHDFEQFLGQTSVFRKPVIESAFISFGNSELLQKGVSLNLIEREIFVGAEGPVSQYWVHPIIQQSQWDKLSENEKLKSHEIAFNWYKDNKDAKKEYEYLNEIVYHAMSAKLVRKACKYAIDLGEVMGKMQLYYERTEIQHLVANAVSQDVISEAIQEKDENVACLLNDLGGAYNNLGKYLKAIDYFKMALKINKKILGEDHKNISIYYNNIGFAYHSLGEYSKSIDYIEKSQKIDIEIFGDVHPEVANNYNHFGTAYNSLGEYSKAIEYYEKALKIHIEFFGEAHEMVASNYFGLGSSYNSLGKYSKAIDYHKKSLNIDKEIFGDSHPSVAKGYNNLGLTYSSLGEYSKAIDYYIKASEINRDHFGDLHHELATNYNNLGEAYHSLGEYSKSIEYYKKSIKIDKEIFGETHPSVACTYNNIGTVYFSLGKYSKGVTYNEKAYRIVLKILGENHPNTKIAYENLLICKKKIYKFSSKKNSIKNNYNKDITNSKKNKILQFPKS